MKEIFVVQIEAAPDGAQQPLDEFGGAYINVYTTELNIRDAIDIAEREVVEAGWRTERVVSAALNSADDFPDEDSGLQYYEQALMDGVVVVVHTFTPQHTESDAFHCAACSLTIHSSRTRFAGRLNSGVRAHMGKFALTVAILAATFCISCADAPATAADLGQAATKLNQQSKTQLGVSIRSLGFLYEARPGVYSLKDAMVSDGSWPFLQELERAGLVKVSTVTGLPNGGEPFSEFVVVELTSKGVQVRDALGAP